MMFAVLLACVGLCSGMFPGFPAAPRAMSGEKADLPPQPPFQETWFEQPLDHFNYGPKGTYKERIFISDAFYKPGGPILFYTGNESPVTDYVQNTGLMTRVLGPQFHGLLIFAEHRYFGQSMPFGNASFDADKVGWLSPEQALADYANFLTTYKAENPALQDAPVIAFGGSYGGMLSAWARMKYPNIFTGSLSASGPFAFYGTNRSDFAYMDRAQRTYAEAGENCDTLIGEALLQMVQAAETSEGRAMLSSVFPTCEPVTSQEDAYNLIQWVQSGLVIMTELDYPAQADYGINLPAWPVNKTCGAIVKQKGGITGLAEGMRNYWACCDQNRTCVDPTVDQPDFAASPGWGYIYCTNSIFPMAQRGMWWPHTTYNLTADMQNCVDMWGIQPRPTWPLTQWGGFSSFKGGSNIIFSNGLLDPWSAEGVSATDVVCDGCPVILIPEAGHHLDLRAPNDQDPHYVVAARQQEADTIAKWIQEHWARIEKHE